VQRSVAVMEAEQVHTNGAALAALLLTMTTVEDGFDGLILGALKSTRGRHAHCDNQLRRTYRAASLQLDFLSVQMTFPLFKRNRWNVGSVSSRVTALMSLSCCSLIRGPSFRRCIRDTNVFNFTR
jgi:hypothetical protein